MIGMCAGLSAGYFYYFTGAPAQKNE